MKKQVSFRLDVELIECLEMLISNFSKLSLTDLVDAMLKEKLVEINADGEEGLDRIVGSYVRGALDQDMHLIHKDLLEMKNDPKVSLKKRN